MCERLGVTTSGYYAWKKRSLNRKGKSDVELLKWIRKVHTKRRRCYGSPRVYRLLKRMGITCSRRRVARVMRESGIKATSVDLYYYNPKRRDHYQRVENLKASEPEPNQLNQQWVADFTYLKTKQSHWVYLATVMDACSRRIVGWSISRTRDAELTSESFLMAVRDRKPIENAIFHTDQGIEYAADKFQSVVKEAGMRPSMSGKGRCLDNAAAESFFHTFKTESFYQKRFKNLSDIKKEFIEYIDFYNNERLHSSLGYMSPREFEQLVA